VTRRILFAIVAVAALSVLAFGVPLALAVRQIEHDDQVATLQRQAAATAAELPPQLHGNDKVEVPRHIESDDVAFAVYDATGKRVTGYGPAAADTVVRAALSGRLAHLADTRQISVGWPLTANERTYGAVRAAVPEAGVEQRVRRVWLLMAVLGLAVVAIAALLAWRQARRLAGPVDALAGGMTRLGHEDFTVNLEPSGVAELDRAGDALTATARRLGRLLARERTFSADASHQLRTPLTGLRLVLESAASKAIEPSEAVAPALAEVDRLEATIDDLLRLARLDRPNVELIDVVPIVSEVARAWAGLAAEHNRPVRVHVSRGLPKARVSPEALREILNVLLSNALVHGSGEIRVTTAATPRGIGVEVSDEGAGVEGGPEEIFQRGAGTGHGIGLALARSLAEAEGCRLALEHAGPHPTFRLLVPVGQQHPPGPSSA